MTAGRPSSADDAVHPGHDPGCGSGKTGHGAKAGPEDESRRQCQDGDRHNHEVVFAAAGVKDQVLRYIAAAADRRESKYGAEGRHIEGEEGIAPDALITAAEPG